MNVFPNEADNFINIWSKDKSPLWKVVLYCVFAVVSVILKIISSSNPKRVFGNYIDFNAIYW
jgi:hypothetical protein